MLPTSCLRQIHDFGSSEIRDIPKLNAPLQSGSLCRRDVGKAGRDVADHEATRKDAWEGAFCRVIKSQT